jgi:hypothetical protein
MFGINTFFKDNSSNCLLCRRSQALYGHSYSAMPSQYGLEGGQSSTSDDDTDRELFEVLKTKGARHLCDVLEIWFIFYPSMIIQYFFALCRLTKISSRASGPWRLLGRNVG